MIGLRDRRGPVLVTGSHRSGTTWVGSVLSSAPATRLVFEPFNIHLRNEQRNFDPRHWYLYLHEDSDPAYRASIASTIKDYPYWQEAVLLRPGLKPLAKYALRRSKYVLRRSSRVIYKDPLAFFSAEWLAAHFGMRPVVMIRHPRAFVSSLLVKGWNFDFTNLSSQPKLMETLAPFREQIAAYARRQPDIVDQGILLWNCIYHRADVYREKHPDWVFARHEDLSRDPVSGFRALFKAVDLHFGPKQARFVEQVSGSHNPSDQDGFGVRLDSRKNLDNWKKRLTNEQIDRIDRGTETVCARFYEPCEA